jgi:hypothetical protein
MALGEIDQQARIEIDQSHERLCSSTSASISSAVRRA